MRNRLAFLTAAPLLSAGSALAQHVGEQPDAAPPLPLTRITWPGVVVILIVGLFLTAAIAGPLIRANMRDDLDSPG